jgi:hypothetical protein
MSTTVREPAVRPTPVLEPDSVAGGGPPPRRRLTATEVRARVAAFAAEREEAFVAAVREDAD